MKNQQLQQEANVNMGAGNDQMDPLQEYMLYRMKSSCYGLIIVTMLSLVGIVIANSWALINLDRSAMIDEVVEKYSELSFLEVAKKREEIEAAEDKIDEYIKVREIVHPIRIVLTVLALVVSIATIAFLCMDKKKLLLGYIIFMPLYLLVQVILIIVLAQTEDFFNNLGDILPIVPISILTIASTMIVLSFYKGWMCCRPQLGFGRHAHPEIMMLARSGVVYGTGVVPVVGMAPAAGMTLATKTAGVSPNTEGLTKVQGPTQNMARKTED